MWGSTFGGISALLIQNARVSTELELLTVNVELLSGIFFKVPEESAAQLLSFKWSRCRIFVGTEVKSHQGKRGK